MGARFLVEPHNTSIALDSAKRRRTAFHWTPLSPVWRVHIAQSPGGKEIVKTERRLFRAILIEKDERGYRADVAELPESRLPDGDVLVDIEFSTLNYKDGLAITGRGPIVRSFPMVPGIDFAGKVAEMFAAVRGSVFPPARRAGFCAAAAQENPAGVCLRRIPRPGDGVSHRRPLRGP